MTGSSFLAYCKQVFRRTDKDAEIYTATADTIMDMRSRMLSDEFATISAALTGISAAGDYVLTLPADFGHLIGEPSVKNVLTDQVYDPLTKISKEEYDVKYSQNLSTAVGNRITGVPTEFCYYGGHLYLGPAVDSTNYEFKINYTTENEPTITGATPTVQFTDQFREVVRAGTLYRIFNEIGLVNDASVWQAAYEQGIQRIIENDLFNASNSSTGIGYSGV